MYTVNLPVQKFTFYSLYMSRFANLTLLFYSTNLLFTLPQYIGMEHLYYFACQKI